MQLTMAVPMTIIKEKRIAIHGGTLMKFLDIGQITEVRADGIHDDTKAIQNCLDRMKDGGTVYFPDGT